MSNALDRLHDTILEEINLRLHAIANYPRDRNAGYAIDAPGPSSFAKPLTSPRPASRRTPANEPHLRDRPAPKVE